MRGLNHTLALVASREPRGKWSAHARSQLIAETKQTTGDKMKNKPFTHTLALATALAALTYAVAPSQAQDSPTPSSGAAGKKPNILFIMGDDIGIWNISTSHRGMTRCRTPNSA